MKKTKSLFTLQLYAEHLSDQEKMDKSFNMDLKFSSHTSLPQEIIREILVRLPVKSLLRFRLVCKAWFNLVQMPDFINDHYQNSSKNQHSLFLQRVYHDKHQHLFQLPCSNFLVLQTKSTELENVPVPSVDNSRYNLCFAGSCNGLICATYESRSINSDRKILLWNPVTRQVKQIPEAQGRCSFVGFGFSPIVKDCKIVIIHKHERKNRNIRFLVYTLSSESLKEVTGSTLRSVKFGKDIVTSNGFLFWSGTEILRPRRWIVSFDLNNETFGEIAVPKAAPKGVRRLTVCGGSIAMLCYSSIFPTTDYCVDLWVMNENSRWSKLFVLGPFLPVERPLGIWEKGIIVVNNEANPIHSRVSERVAVLYLCGFNGEKKKHIASHRCEPFFGFSICFNYAESLALAGNRNEDLDEAHFDEPENLQLLHRWMLSFDEQI